MSIYKKRALADSTGDYLATSLGEVLMVLDKTSFDLQLLNRVLQSQSYKTHFRLFVLNPDETIDYEIPQEDIILGSGNYSENYQQGQRRNINISLVNIDGNYTPSINTIWVHNKFRFDVGIEYNNEIFWFPRGIYVLSNPSVTHNDADKQVSLTLVDKFALLEGKTGTLETTYEIPVGIDIKKAIQSILTLDTGSGYPLDLKPIIYDSSFEGKTMPYTLRKDAGGTFGEIILDLAIMLNAECFYNDLGNLCFININETISDFNKPVLWNYDENEEELFNLSGNFNFDNVVNQVNIIGDNINGELFSAFAINDNPISPICIANIGRRILSINDSNIYSDELAQDRANYELRKASILETTVSANVAFNPLLFVNNLITTNDSYLNLERQKFIIQSISYTIGNDNMMNLTCSNLNNFTLV